MAEGTVMRREEEVSVGVMVGEATVEGVTVAVMVEGKVAVATVGVTAVMPVVGKVTYLILRLLQLPLDLR